MIILVGNTGCSRCAMVKNILESKKIDFKYIIFDSLDNDTQDRVMKKATENGLMSFPMAFDENKKIFNVNALL